MEIKNYDKTNSLQCLDGQEEGKSVELPGIPPMSQWPRGTIPSPRSRLPDC